LGLRGERLPIKWTRLIGKESPKTEKLTQVLFEKGRQLLRFRGFLFRLSDSRRPGCAPQAAGPERKNDGLCGKSFANEKKLWF
jgi:hypothetical protein